MNYSLDWDSKAEQDRGHPLDGLIARLYEAQEPDRNIDRDIWWMVDRPAASRVYWQASTGMPRPIGDVMPEGLGKWNVRNAAPSYTSSMHSALLLIPERHKWKVGCGDYVQYVAEVWPSWRGHHGISVGEVDSYPAIALSLAAIKARAALNIHHHGGANG